MSFMETSRLESPELSSRIRQRKSPSLTVPTYLPVPGDDGDGGVAVVPHLFQALAEGAVVVQEGHIRSSGIRK
jgi:hypothetical protein